MTFKLMSHVEVLTICGPTPSLAQLEQDVGRFWVPAVESLHSVRKISPRNFPLNIDIDTNIMAFILINTATNHSVSSVDPRKDVKDPSELRHRRQCMRSFFQLRHRVVSHITTGYRRGEICWLGSPSRSNRRLHSVHQPQVLRPHRRQLPAVCHVFSKDSYLRNEVCLWKDVECFHKGQVCIDMRLTALWENLWLTRITTFEISFHLKQQLAVGLHV